MGDEPIGMSRLFNTEFNLNHCCVGWVLVFKIYRHRLFNNNNECVSIDYNYDKKGSKIKFMRKLSLFVRRIRKFLIYN